MSLSKKIIFSLFGATVVAGGLFWYFQIYQKQPLSITFLQPKKEKPKVVEVKKAVCPLDGLSVKEEVANRHPLAIMIENHIDARPQSGLSEASLIYEAIAEGGITRFMALYVWGEPEKVGPVRSARTYDLDWLSEFNAFYAHVGGNYTALQQIKQYGILDLDQFKYGTQAYWREPQAGKATEHTMYTKPTKLWNIASKNKWDIKGSYESFEFKDDLEKSLRPVSASVTINFSTSNYQVKWVYDPETNLYKREQVKGPDVKAKNIIVEWMERSSTISAIGEKSWAMKTIGTGKAKIFMDGKVIEGTWKKESRTSRTWFYDTSGAKIKFNRGQTWVEIVHPELSVVVK